MIHLFENQTTTVTLTLAEKTTVPTPVYTMKVSSDQKREEKAIVLNDLSLFPNSYNQFDLSPDMLNLEKMFGDYEYIVTQQDNTIVERGKLRYHREMTNPEAFSNPNKNNEVYGEH